jgi:hypothetical protein
MITFLSDERVVYCREEKIKEEEKGGKRNLLKKKR